MKNSCSVGCGFTVSNFHLPTLPETNIAPEHWWLEDGFPCGICHFQGRAVGFRDCKLVEGEPKLIHFGESLRRWLKRGLFLGSFVYEGVMRLMSNSRKSWRYALSTSAKGLVYPMYSCLSNVFFKRLQTQHVRANSLCFCNVKDRQMNKIYKHV